MQMLLHVRRRQQLVHKPVEALQLERDRLALTLLIAVPIRRVHVRVAVRLVNVRYLFFAISEEPQQVDRLPLLLLSLAHFVEVLADGAGATCRENVV